VIYEVNTAVWLDGLSRAAGRPLTLSDVGSAAWDAICPGGTDAVWLIPGSPVTFVPTAAGGHDAKWGVAGRIRRR
jgi:hypothetical protein